jgi:acetylornithine/N-succinyldiaminopimelate aminotransferase
MGFLIGIKVSPELNLFIKKLFYNKLLTIRAAENVVRLLPPLNVKKENIDQAIVILRKVCKTFK